ncbi:hypothetical protein AVEN_212319-1 [Araneus ventricosus]|uniref:Uncharacterized protein n=1 Tax=Araneus ventricosus TaxID=182803 RepID=A0A4Y2ICT6_ARAVE|nr:hypothetical protein AVEN_212319-1 [Araneus ventricosus]
MSNRMVSANDLPPKEIPVWQEEQEDRDWMECQPVHRLLAVTVCAGLSENRKIDNSDPDLDFIACVCLRAQKLVPRTGILQGKMALVSRSVDFYC